MSQYTDDEITYEVVYDPCEESSSAGCVDLVDLAKGSSCYENFAIKCDLAGVKPPTEDEFNNYSCNGGNCLKSVVPTIETMHMLFGDNENEEECI